MSRKAAVQSCKCYISPFSYYPLKPCLKFYIARIANMPFHITDTDRRAPGHTHEDAFDVGKLAVSNIHTLHYEQYGNKEGRPGKQRILHSRD